MATRVCPRCGSQYVASVRRCIDCDVVLVEEVRDDGEARQPSAASPVGEGDTIAYELEGWGSQLKVTLEGMLDRADIRRVWEAGALVVPAAREEEVDALIATVEGGEAVALADDEPVVAFEIEGWTPEELDELDAVLIAAQVAHAWDEDGALLVGEADEDEVAGLIDGLLGGDDDDGDGDDDGGGEVDGLAVTEALTALYVAVDKLHKDPLDAKLGARFATAADAVSGLGVPYGLTADEWSALLDQVEDLRSAITADADAEIVDEDEASSDDGDDEADGDEADGDEPTPAPSRRDRAHEAALALRARLQDLV